MLDIEINIYFISIFNKLKNLKNNFIFYLVERVVILVLVFTKKEKITILHFTISTSFSRKKMKNNFLMERRQKT